MIIFITSANVLQSFKPPKNLSYMTKKIFGYIIKAIKTSSAKINVIIKVFFQFSFKSQINSDKSTTHKMMRYVLESVKQPAIAVNTNKIMYGTFFLLTIMKYANAAIRISQASANTLVCLNRAANLNEESPKDSVITDFKYGEM